MSDQPSGEVILYRRAEGVPALEVRLDGETVWLSQQQPADLFQTSRTNIVEHIQHIYGEGALSEARTCRKFRQVRTEGSRQVEREATVKDSLTVRHEGSREMRRTSAFCSLDAVKRTQRQIEGKQL